LCYLGGCTATFASGGDMNSHQQFSEISRAAFEAEEKAAHYAMVVEAVKAEASHYARIADEAAKKAADHAKEADEARAKANLLARKVDEIVQEAKQYAKEADDMREKAAQYNKAISEGGRSANLAKLKRQFEEAEAAFLKAEKEYVSLLENASS